MNTKTMNRANSPTTELTRKLAGMPIDQALPYARKALAGMNSDAMAQLWQGMRQLDRTFGILFVAFKLRMPRYPVFGSALIPRGDHLTDYDHAREFILATRANEGIAGRVPGLFYPEVRHLSVEQRVLALGRGHIGCDPSGVKQCNLFSLNGILNRQQITATTRPGTGTTCSNFLRAVLIAAGHLGLADRMSSLAPGTVPKPHMIFSMGVGYDEGAFRVTTPEWVVATRFHNKQGLEQGAIPSPGDAYYVLIPGVLANSGKKDSGHVGIVVSAQRHGNSITMHTIDGGQSSTGAGGYWTTETPRRTFTKGAGGDWEMTSHAMVQGQFRILVGWARIAQTGSNFDNDEYTTLPDGRVIRAVI